jgi:hypothetical protein
MLKKLLALLVLPLVTLLVVAGCSTPSDTSNDRDDDETSQSDDDGDEEGESEAPAEGELAEPGTRVGIDEWLTHSFTSTDDGEALISARLVSVEPATDEEAAFIVSAFDDGKVDGYDFYLVHVEEKKESGDSVEFDSDYSFFDVVDKDGDQVQEITIIGWDGCETDSFDEEFDTAGGVLTQCFIGAAKSGDLKPAGVLYKGGYEDDNPYSSYDGKPLYFIKG